MHTYVNLCICIACLSVSLSLSIYIYSLNTACHCGIPLYVAAGSRLAVCWQAVARHRLSGAALACNAGLCPRTTLTPRQFTIGTPGFDGVKSCFVCFLSCHQARVGTSASPSECAVLDLPIPLFPGGYNGSPCRGVDALVEYCHQFTTHH